MKLEAARNTYYHGTSSRNLRKILKEGLNPEAKDKLYDRPEYEGGSGGRSLSPYGGVYLTDNIMSAYSFSGTAAQKMGGGRIILVVTYDTSTPNTLVDEDTYMRVAEHIIGHRFESVLYPNNPIGEKLYSQGVSPGSIYYILKGLEENPKDYEETFQNIYHTLRDTDITPMIDRFLTELERINGSEIKSLQHREGKIRETVEQTLKLYALHLLDLEINTPAVDLNWVLPALKDQANKAMSYMPELSNPKEDEFDHRIRSTEPIGFSGKNRILAIGELINEPDSGHVLKMHYGQNYWGEYRPLLEDFIGGDYTVVDTEDDVIYDSPRVAASVRRILRKSLKY
jgi:hypothetical protein